MDVLLIDPPYKSLKGIGTEVGYTMGLTSLAAYLRQHGLEAAVLTGDTLLDLPPSSPFTLDMAAYARGQAQYQQILDDPDHEVWRRLTRVVRQANPGVVGLSYLTPLQGAVACTVAAVKAANPDLPIIVGGHHPTFCPEETARLDGVDFVVRGEGEAPLLALARALVRGEGAVHDAPGVTFLDSSQQLVSTPAPALLPDLDALPEPARELVLDCDYSRFRTHYATSARGCPYSCTFCSDRELWRAKVRRRSVDSFVDELARLGQQHHPAFVDLVDGTFTYNRKFTEAFCRRMIDQRVNILWRCTARYDTVDQDLLPLLKRAGCAALYFGLESGSQRVLDRADKGLSIEQIRRKSLLVREHGMVAITAVLLGMPGETAEDLQDTLDLMRAVHADIFDVNTYVPLPGSPLYEQMDPAARAAIDWRKAAYKSLDNQSSEIPPDQLRELQQQAYGIAADALQRFRRHMTPRQSTVTGALPPAG